MSLVNDNFALKDNGYSNYVDTLHAFRHRWYYYKEGFSPLFVEKAVEHAQVGKDDIILDPFNGSGTTTLTASILGHRSIGIEVNPFTSFLAETKLKNADMGKFNICADSVIAGADTQSPSSLLGFSTFSHYDGNKKWLFNDDVLNSFEGGWKAACGNTSPQIEQLNKLALINAAMDNCNARKDGKCLRYIPNWQEKKFDKESFLQALERNLSIIKNDIEALPLESNAQIINGDARKILKKGRIDKFKLCVTSPPYLNTFDYTDIYRPELFLGKFILNSEQLYDLRLKTVRSHIQAKWLAPNSSDFGMLYQQTMSHLAIHRDTLMHKNIPLMVQAYFEDMLNILTLLKNKAMKGAEVWLVVSNSAYADREIPVDLIIAELGTRVGWFLKEVGVLRYIKRRKTNGSPNVTTLRESVVIFSEMK